MNRTTAAIAQVADDFRYRPLGRVIIWPVLAATAFGASLVPLGVFGDPPNLAAYAIVVGGIVAATVWHHTHWGAKRMLSAGVPRNAIADAIRHNDTNSGIIAMVGLFFAFTATSVGDYGGPVARFAFEYTTTAAGSMLGMAVGLAAGCVSGRRHLNTTNGGT